MTKNLRLLSLQVANFRRLQAVDLKIDPEKNVIEVAGKNAQGKSSLIDAIEFLISGPPRKGGGIVRNGQPQTVVIGDLGECIVTRTLTESGKQELRIETAAGIQIETPRDFLQKALGSAFLDVSTFTEGKTPEDGRSRVAALSSVCKLPETYEDFKARLKAKTTERTELSRAHKTASTQLEALINDNGPLHADSTIPDKEISIKETLSSIAAAATKRTDLANLERDISDYQSDIADLEAQIELKKRALNELKDRITSLTPEVMSDESFKALQNMVETSEATNHKIRTKKTMITVAEETTTSASKMDLLKTEIAEMRNNFVSTISNAIPIDGMTIEDDEIYLNGIPFPNLSTAEKIRIAAEVAVRNEARLRLLKVSQGSLLDEDARAILDELAEKYDFQVFLERVGSDERSTIIIDDGKVKDALEPSSTKKEKEDVAKREEPSKESQPFDEVISRESPDDDFLLF